VKVERPNDRQAEPSHSHKLGYGSIDLSELEAI
jgi:hypothetical protein